MIRRNMKNTEIYETARGLIENINPLNLLLPVKVSFYLQKNIKAIVDIATDIDNARMEIFNRYGTPDPETGAYNFEEDVQMKINQELTDLFELEQEVPIYEISLDAFDEVKLDMKQVQAISYMLKEEEE